MKRWLFCKSFFLAVSIIILASFVSATFNFNLNGSSIGKQYLGGETILGKINISFSNQANSMFSSNFEGGASLYSVLLKSGYSAGNGFNCIPSSCTAGYQPGDFPVKEKSVLIKNNEENSVGIVLTGGEILDISESFSFNFTSPVGESCKNQLYIDLFNDGEIDFYNENYSQITCGERTYGCFEDINTKEAIVSSRKYCENVTLPAAAGYRIGAIIKNNSVDGGKLHFYIKNMDTGNSANCPDNNKALDFGSEVAGRPGYHEINCRVGLPSTEAFKAFVCIADTDDSNKYKIKTKDTGEFCGISEKIIPSSMEAAKFVADYEIYAEPVAFRPIGEIRFDKFFYSRQKLHSGEDLIKKITNYLNETYKMNCTKGCVIPMKLRGVEQNVLIKDINMVYSTASASISQDEIDDLEESDFTISSGYLNLDVENMKIKSPQTNGAQNIELYLDNVFLMNETVNVAVGFDFTVGPRFALVGQETLFTAFTTQNTSSSKWNFGDGSAVQTSSSKQQSHRYTTSGEYQLQVTLIGTNRNESTKKFKIIVGDPETSANLTIAKYGVALSNPTGQIGTYGDWIQTSIKEKINFDTTISTFNRIKSDYEDLGSNANSSDFEAILNRLAMLDIPSGVKTMRRGEPPWELGFENMKVSLVSEASGGGTSVTNEKEMINEVTAWIYDNYQGEASFESVSLIGEFETEQLLTYYRIKVTPKGRDISPPVYLAIDYPKSGIDFKSNYDVRDAAGGTGTVMPISEVGSAQTVEFIIVGASTPAFEDLGIFVSPSLTEFDVGPPLCELDDPECAPPGFPFGKYIIAMCLLILAILVLYIFLQEWYKRNYQKTLFKNPDELYNIINFIYNSRMSGLRDEQIKQGLKGTGWNSEHIIFAFKKIDGKKTGMWEIPIFKFFEHGKIKKEIQKQHPGEQINPKFMKQQRY